MKTKQLAQSCVKNALLLAGLLRRSEDTGFTYLIYHSVNGELSLELDLPPALLERQFGYLAQTGQVIDYTTAFALLQEKVASLSKGFVLTFDDGYLDFYTRVYPLLQRWQLPATLFVTTGFVEERIAYPMLSHPRLAVEPVTWEMLGEMQESGLVTLGAHTHTHPVLTNVSSMQIQEELAKPLALFQARLGLTPQHFCYPRAVWRPDIEQQVARYYQSAVIGGGYSATSQHFHPYRIPRLPIRRSDGWRYFRAKVEGRMANEEAFYARWR